MSSLSLADLVSNGTLSPTMAAALAAAAEQRLSLLFAAIPRLAGKTTLLEATLAHRPPGTPVHHLSRAHGPSLGIPPDAEAGYLMVSEISPAGFADYLWGDDVRRAFAAAWGRSLPIATALHAGSLGEAFAILTRLNGVPDDQASTIRLFAYLRSLGPHWSRPTRRVLAQLWEVQAVEGDHVRADLIESWDEASDRFTPGPAAGPQSVTSSEAFQRHQRVFVALSPGERPP